MRRAIAYPVTPNAFRTALSMNTIELPAGVAPANIRLCAILTAKCTNSKLDIINMHELRQ